MACQSRNCSTASSTTAVGDKQVGDKHDGDNTKHTRHAKGPVVGTVNTVLFPALTSRVLLNCAAKLYCMHDMAGIGATHIDAVGKRYTQRVFHIALPT